MNYNMKDVLDKLGRDNKTVRKRAIELGITKRIESNKNNKEVSEKEKGDI